MKKLFLILLVGLLFVGCSPCKRFQRRCPPQMETIIQDSIVYRDTIIYKDKEVPYYIPGDTQYVDKPVPVKEDISPISLENKYALAKAWVENSRLKLLLETKDQVINIRIDSAIQIAKHWEYQWKNKKQTITLPAEKYIPKIYKIAFFLCVSGIISLGIYLYIKIRAGALKTLLGRFLKK